MQYMVEKYGPKCYTIAADYNFGQLTAAWTKAFIPLVGGKKSLAKSSFHSRCPNSAR